MLDLLYHWPPRPHTRRTRRAIRSSLTLVRNNIRQAHNHTILDRALVEAAKFGHLIRAWVWETPTLVTAECCECGAALTVDTTLARGYEYQDSPAVTAFCR